MKADLLRSRVFQVRQVHVACCWIASPNARAQAQRKEPRDRKRSLQVGKRGLEEGCREESPWGNVGCIVPEALPPIGLGLCMGPAGWDSEVGSGNKPRNTELHLSLA